MTCPTCGGKVLAVEGNDTTEYVADKVAEADKLADFDELAFGPKKKPKNPKFSPSK